MSSQSTISQDLALKRTVHSTTDQVPRFPWRNLVAGHDIPAPSVAIDNGQSDESFTLGDIADTIGTALTGASIARGEASDIFSSKNQEWVLRVCTEVAGNLGTLAARGPLRITLEALYELIEKTLVDNNAYFVAKSLLENRARRIFADRSGSLLMPQVIRRSKQTVAWNPHKIEIAVRKSFLSMQRDSAPAVAIAKRVMERVQAARPVYVTIEEIQDMVQEELMRAGHYKVAEAYILFRATRAAERTLPKDEAQLDLPGAGQSTMLVIKAANGDSTFWDGEDLRCRIEFARIGLDLNLSNQEIEEELRRSLADQISKKDLATTIILNSKTLIERDADFAKFAGRLQLTYIYEEVLGWDIVGDGIGKLKDFHQRAFRKYLEHAVSVQRLSPRLLDYDAGMLAAALDPSSDLDFDFLGIQTLYDRYLLVDKTGKNPKRMEAPQFFWMRVAMGIFLAEAGNREEKVIGLYGLYKSRRFCSSTPTLFNSGSLRSQLSSCFLYTVPDSIEGIFQRGIAENAYLAKWAGGLGGSWTAVRGTGAHIAGTNGESQGVIPFLKLHNDQLVAVNQGGRRKGSGCAYLETWHVDIYEFLELRKNVGDDRRRTHDMNTANWIPDLFMKRVEARQSWTLFRSNEVPDLHEIYGRKFEERYTHYEHLAAEGKIFGQKIEALDLWKKMLSMLFETGHPWITFKDAFNVRSPQDHVGVIHSSNLCSEIGLNTSADETAVCNLGSVILDSHLLANGSLDLPKLRETVRMAVRALDNVIDLNYYPTEAAKRANMRHRPVGLGIMGLANTLYMKGISFASEAAVEFSDEAMEAVAFFAYEASSDLAAERGTYQTYQGSKWSRGILPQDTLDILQEERGMEIKVPRGGRLDWAPLRAKIAANGMRNSNVLAIAPTATISNITNTSPCIEPTYKNMFVKSNLSGEFIVLNPFMVKDLKAAGLWDREMVDELKYHDGELQNIARIPESLKARYLTAFDIDPKWILAAAARRQKWIDQAQSLNLWLKTPDLKALSHLYREAWALATKSTYYLRTLQASNIEKATVSVKKEVRGFAGEHGADEAATQKSVASEAAKIACSIEAQRRGEECLACQ